MKPKMIQIVTELEGKIKDGSLGESGSRFLTIRELASHYRIAIGTAHKVVEALRKKRLVQLMGKNHYLSYGIYPKSAEIRRLLKTKNIVGVHLFDFDSYTVKIAKALEANIVKNGYEAVVASSNFSLEREEAILNSFRDLEVVGMVTCTINFPGRKKIYESYPLPLQFFGTKPEGIWGNKVFGEEMLAAEDLGRHLLDQGYERFLFLGVARWEEATRFLGVLRAIRRRGIILQKDHLVVLRDSHQDLVGKLRSFLAWQEKPIALICFNDVIAIKALEFCKLYGYRVPDEVGIAGYDDTLEAEYHGITSIRVNVEKIAEESVKLLIGQIQSCRRENQVLSVKNLLKIRRSTKLKEKLIE